MNTGPDNAILAKRLGDACGNRRIKLPTSVAFTLQDASVRMCLAASGVMANMQSDASAFEGWALALKRWLPDIARVELAWLSDTPPASSHYQRFLFRVGQFATIFPSWFSIAAANAHELQELKTNGDGPYHVTAPKGARVTREKYTCGTIAQAMASEHPLECYIKDNPAPLMGLLGMDTLDRQYPVGLFDGAVKRDNKLFPTGHSAIDLWGVSGTDLVLFELKAAGNIPIGALSELFFYSYLIEGIQKKRFTLERPDDRITSTQAVRAYVLAPAWHPLIDDELLRRINDGFRRHQRRIRFGLVRITPAQPQPFVLAMRACD